MDEIIGKTFGRLIVIEKTLKPEHLKRKYGSYYKCRCECGNETIILGTKIKNKHVFSCGCLRKENNLKSCKTHGMSYTRLNKIFRGIKNRCYNKNDYHYKWYGERNIIICDEWLDKENGFMNFYNWSMNNGYNEILSIDRINNNGNYEPNNCRWATDKEQQNNRRNNKIIEYNNQIYTISELAEKYNIKKSILYSRLKQQWTIEESLTLNMNFSVGFSIKRYRKIKEGVAIQ